MMISNRMKTGLHRLKKTMSGQEADRVPIVAQIGAHTIQLTKVPIEKFLSDPDLFIHTHLKVSEYYQLDAPSFFYDLYNIEAEALGQSLVWLEGEFPEIKSNDMLIKSPKDLDKLKPPDPRRDGRIPFIIELYKRLIDFGLPTQLRFCAPFSLACNVRGISNLLEDIIVNPDFSHRLFTFLTDEVLAPFITEFRNKCGSKLPVLGADALASLPVTNLSIIEEFALGYTKRLRKLVGGIVEVRGWWGEKYLHDPLQLLKLKNEGHPSCVLGLDPDVHEVGPEIFKQFAVQNNLPLMLGIDCNLVARGPIMDIVERVRNYLRVGNQKGQFIQFLNEVPPGCPSEHVHAAVQAVHHFSNTDLEAESFRYQTRPAFEVWENE